MVFCLPCCMAQPYNDPERSLAKYKLYKECLGEQIEESGTDKDIYYILNKISTIPINRFGLLNPTLQNIFDSNCKGGYLDVNTLCFVRKRNGIK